MADQKECRMATKTTFETVMGELASAFETAKRDSSGENFVRLKDEGRPEWLAGSDVMREIHSAQDDRMPDDWTYAAIEALAEAFRDHDCDSERSANRALHEHTPKSSQSGARPRRVSRSRSPTWHPLLIVPRFNSANRPREG